ncbi:MAG TPA: hypothetical protein VJU82_04215 [Acidobacteriaceae bacterium]|nr:hypothetical protein [Acidobacteriaceae bacterium]
MRLVRLWRCSSILLAFVSLHTHSAKALEVKVSADALERTLKAQLFSGPDGRYYMRGDAHSACYVYAESPHVVFKDDRVVVHVHTHSKLGTGLRSTCLGLGLTADADVSLVPEGEGESIGFRDARIDHLSESRELNFFLVPFLSRKLPAEMKVNAADLIGKLLSQSVASTGYSLKLDSLKLHSMVVDHDSLVVDVDANVSVH